MRNKCIFIVLAELVSFIKLSATDQNTAPVFKVTDLAEMYKKRLIELGAHARVHTTKLKNRIMAHFENIRDFKEGNTSYLVFDADIGSALKSVCDTDYDDEAFILSKAASIQRRDIFSKENKEFDGKLH